MHGALIAFAYVAACDGLTTRQRGWTSLREQSLRRHRIKSDEDDKTHDGGPEAAHAKGLT
jgi:hypothetical protein